MIQLCFGDSVKGTLTCAPHIGNTIGGATAVVISTDKPLDTPLQKAAFAVYRTLAAPFYKRRAQKQEARRRAEAVPVDYESNDVIALLGDLNEGPIAGGLMSEARKEVVRAWLCFSPHGDTAGTDADVEPYWQACQKDLQTLLTRAHTGEPVRIWYDHTPASLCGLHAAAALLEDAPCQITVVETPELETKNGVTRRAPLGERGPTEMGALLQYERPRQTPTATPLPPAGAACKWKRPLAPSKPPLDQRPRRGFYDAMILSEAPANENAVAQLIGKAGRMPPGHQRPAHLPPHRTPETIRQISLRPTQPRPLPGNHPQGVTYRQFLHNIKPLLFGQGVLFQYFIIIDQAAIGQDLSPASVMAPRRTLNSTRPPSCLTAMAVISSAAFQQALRMPGR